MWVENEDEVYVQVCYVQMNPGAFVSESSFLSVLPTGYECLCVFHDKW